MKVLIVGCGYVGTELVRICNQLGGYDLHALTRSEQRADELARLGVAPIVGDWIEESCALSLPAFDGVVFAVPHRAVDPLAEQTHVQGLIHFGRSAAASAKWVYLSTTGVYGAASGQTVDETTPVSPERIAGAIAVNAENWLFGNRPENNSVVLRPAGIYGPGRMPLASKLIAAEPLPVDDGWLNLIHVTDLAEMVRYALEHQLAHPVYVLSDGHATRRSEFYAELATRLGTPPPVFDAGLASERTGRRVSDKVVQPQRFLTETNWQLRFPDFRAGIAQSLASAQ